MTSRLSVVLSLAAAFGAALAFSPSSASAQQTPAAQQTDADRSPMDVMGPMHHMTQEDRQAFLDARLAAVHAGLKLSPEQEKLWPVVESTIHNAITQMRDARQKIRSESKETDKSDPIARMRRTVEKITRRAQVLSKLADAAQPLYASLTDDQKWRLHVLLHAIHPHPHHTAMMERGRDGDHQQDER